MLLRFKIKNDADSVRHQSLFFKLGYKWAVYGQVISNTEKPYLYIRDKVKPENGIMYSVSLQPDPDEVECKLLHPKQLEFLKQYNYFVKDIIIGTIIKDGYYKINQVDYLNDIRHHYSVVNKIYMK